MLDLPVEDKLNVFGVFEGNINAIDYLTQGSANSGCGTNPAYHLFLLWLIVKDGFHIFKPLKKVKCRIEWKLSHDMKVV